MKFVIFFSGLFFFICYTGSVFAQDTTKTNVQQAKHGQSFIDEDGDGYNDNAPDHDKDGIPNGLDPDWQKLTKEKRKKRFTDLDGDGIDDNLQTNKLQERKGERQLHDSESSMENKGKNRNEQRRKNGGRKQ